MLRWGLRSLQDERMFELWLGDRCLLLPTYLDDIHRVRDTSDRANVSLDPDQVLEAVLLDVPGLAEGTR